MICIWKYFGCHCLSAQRRAEKKSKQLTNKTDENNIEIVREGENDVKKNYHPEMYNNVLGGGGGGVVTDRLGGKNA